MSNLLRKNEDALNAENALRRDRGQPEPFSATAVNRADRQIKVSRECYLRYADLRRERRETACGNPATYRLNLGEVGRFEIFGRRPILLVHPQFYLPSS